MHDIQNQVDDDESIEQLMTLDESNETQPEGAPKDAQRRIDPDNEMDEMKATSVSKCMRILRFLQLLTENHFTPMQNYLRE